MQINLIKENEDGSADYTMHFSEEDKDNIVRWAVMHAIQKYIDEGKSYDPGELSVGDTTSGGEDSVHGSGEQPSKPEQPSDGFKTSQVLG
jgi:hypothetical protein